MRRCLLFFLFAFLAFSGLAATQAQTAAPTGQDRELSIPTGQAWIDTGIDLGAGGTLTLTAAPSSVAGQAVPDRHAILRPVSSCDPSGTAGSVSGNLPVSSAPAGALIARLGVQGEPFLVGATKVIKVDQQARLFLGSNDTGSPVCKGTFAVSVHFTAANQPADAAGNALDGNQQNATTTTVKSKLMTAAQTWLGGQFGTGAGSSAGSTNAAVASNGNAGSGTSASKPADEVTASSAALDARLSEAIDNLPRRVNDKFNHLGDMVNFVIVGSEKDVQAALDAANWHVADKSTTTAVAKAVLMATEKQDYLQMPMSQLYLFDRVQDFGYEQAEPYAVVASRHHFRIWKAPFEFNGRQVWAGAGTHDIGFEKDQRNGSVTHKIDPAVDGERDHIAASLQKSGKTKSVTYHLPPNPIQDARNATGGGYHSDGRMVVIELK